MSVTTIKLDTETKLELDRFREYKNESYDEVIRKVVYIAKNVKKKPQLSRETVKSIEEARARMKKGEYVTLKELEKRLGL